MAQTIIFTRSNQNWCVVRVPSPPYFYAEIGVRYGRVINKVIGGSRWAPHNLHI